MDHPRAYHHSPPAQLNVHQDDGNSATLNPCVHTHRPLSQPPTLVDTAHTNPLRRSLHALTSRRKHLYRKRPRASSSYQELTGPCSLHSGAEDDDEHAYRLPRTVRSVDLERSPSSQSTTYSVMEHLLSWREQLDVREFYSMDVWRAAAIEFVITMLFTYTSISSSLLAQEMGYSNLVVAVTHVFLVTLLIMATASASGALFNPNITLTMMLIKMISVPRAVLYILAQCIGATIGGVLIRISATTPFKYILMSRCYSDTRDGVLPVFVHDLVSTWLFAFLTLYMALDARQRRVYGPVIGPLVCGLVVGITIVSSKASMNPARCLGSEVASLTFTDHWINWTAGITASLLNGLLYNAIPPHHSDMYKCM